MHEAQADLYDRDFYAWTQRQAKALRRWAASRPNLDLDLAHIAEEIADLGKEQRNALRSWTVRIIEHLLLLEHSPAQEPRRHWTREIIGFRDEIAERITANSPPRSEPPAANAVRACPPSSCDRARALRRGGYHAPAARTMPLHARASPRRLVAGLIPHRPRHTGLRLSANALVVALVEAPRQPPDLSRRRPHARARHRPSGPVGASAGASAGPPGSGTSSAGSRRHRR